MRVVIFTEVLTPYVSGVSSYVDVLKKGLEKLNHQVLIVTSSIHTTKPVFKDGIIRCPAKTVNNKYGYECKKTNDYKLIKFIREFKPDVVHIQTDSKIGYMGLFIADKLNKPVIFTIHDYYNDRFANSESKLVWQFKTMFEKKHFVDMLDNADIVTSSCRRANMFVRSAGRKRKVTLVPTCTDTKRFNYTTVNPQTVQKMRRKFGLSPTASVAIFTGELTIEKNLEFVLKSIAKYIKPNDNIQFLIVGDGTETAYLKRLCIRLGIHKMVFFAGSVAHSIMPEIYSACDVYVCSYDDGLMSMSFSEAMACGLPVLIKQDKEHFVNTMITNGVNGFVYENEKQFAQYLKTLSNITEEQRIQIKKVVRRTVSANTSKKMAQSYIQIYTDAMRIHRMKQ